MSYAKTPQVIYDQMNTKSLRYWQVFDSDKTSQIAESEDDDNLTVGNSILDLQNVLESLDGIIHVVVRSDGAIKKRKVNSTGEQAQRDSYAGIYKFQLRLGTALEAAQSKGDGLGSLQNNTMFAMLLKLQEEKHAQSLEFMQAKFDQEKEFSKRFDELAKKIEKKSGGDSEIDDKMKSKIFDLMDRLLRKEQIKP